MVNYRALSLIPPLVKRALNLADQMNYLESCSVEVGRLLQLLASQHQSGVIGEISTGCGVAAAWIASGLAPNTTFLTVEEDPTRAAAASSLFESLLNVRVVHGAWQDVINNWQFSMLYVGRHTARTAEPLMLLQALGEGSLIVFDGLPPQERLSLRLPVDVEHTRDFWLNDPRLLATEIQVSAHEAVILATRASL